RALRQATAQRGFIQAQHFIELQVNDATRHSRTEPRPRIAQHQAAPAGHILKGKALDVGARSDTTQFILQRFAQLTRNDQIRARQANACTRIGVALHDQRAALRAVAEAFAHRTVGAMAVVVHAFEDGNRTAAGAFGRTVLYAAFDGDVYAVNVVGAKAIARNRA